MSKTDKPSSNEDEYFAAEDIEKKRKLAFEQAHKLAQQEKAERQRLHFMKCPKCGMDLHELKHGEVAVDTCFNCHGVWLDAGELDAIMKQGPDASRTWMGAVLNLFSRK